MTRMLCTLLAILLMTSMMGGCSLFSGEANSSDAAEVDTESVSGGVLDAEDEMLAESSDLVADESFGDTSELDKAGTEASLDSEFESAELDGDDDFGGDGDDFYTDDGFATEEDEFSTTSADNVDPALADDELDEFNEFDDGDTKDEFALDAEPVVDEPQPDQPIVDLPDDGPTGLENQITNLEYKSFENGGTVVIETSRPAEYQKIVDSKLNQVTIQVFDVFLPERFKRPYVTKDFKQDIATINAYTDAAGAARFVIQMKRPVEPQVQKTGSSILVMTAGGAPMQTASTDELMDADPLDDPGPNEQSLDQLVAENQMQTTATSQSNKATNSAGSLNINTLNSGLAAASNSFGGAEKSGMSLNPTNFSGEKINLEFLDTDVREIIEVIAERSGVNLIMDKEVGGKTSIRLRQVPWDQALLVLLRSQGLGYVKQGSVLRIAKQATLSSEAKAVSSQIKSEKEAKLLSGGIKVKYIPVSYAKVSELAGKLKDFTSKEGKIAFDDRTSSLVITDYGEYIERIGDLVKALDTAPMQVEIEAKLVEARETFIREAGINWDIVGQEFPFGSQTGSINAGLGGNLSQEGFSLDLNVGTFDIFGDLSAALSVFESDNKIKVLSQPRIVTMNKVKATITQTLQVPITETLIAAAGALPQVSFRFIDVVLGLTVTPQITFKGDVILEVNLKRDFAGAISGNGGREINKREANSTVMVKNGKTAVIGGIYQLDEGDTETGIPLLKDIPLIGYLFKQTKIEKIKNELLLFLKPKILREVDGPMVSKNKGPGGDYDAFEELSVDEGSAPVDEVMLETPSESNDLEGDDFDDAEFEEEGDSLLF